MRWIPRVKRPALLLIAGFVWFAAGFNIMRIGTPDMLKNWNRPFLTLLAAIVVFFLFFRYIFWNMVKKHTRRIRSYEQERIPVLKFFDGKSYCIMAFMIAFGVLLRASHLVPPLYLGAFYTGLGGSLLGAGVLFFAAFVRERQLGKEELR